MRPPPKESRPDVSPGCRAEDGAACLRFMGATLRRHRARTATLAALALVVIGGGCSNSGDGSTMAAAGSTSTPNRPATIPVPPGEDPETFVAPTGSMSTSEDCRTRCDTLTVRLAPSASAADAGFSSADAGEGGDSSSCPPPEDALEAAPESSGPPYCDESAEAPTIVGGQCAYRVRLCIQCCP